MLLKAPNQASDWPVRYRQGALIFQAATGPMHRLLAGSGSLLGNRCHLHVSGHGQSMVEHTLRTSNRGEVVPPGSPIMFL